jgi:predicted MFS family arabinose efflux permease
MSSPPNFPPDGIVAPFRHVFFRRIWIASLLSNFGLLIQGVGAAWAMTVLTGRPNWVALVQSALTLPTMLLSVAAGAIADMYDRRLIGLAALSLSLTAAAGLSALAFAGKLDPYGILIFCLLIGSGMAIFGPSWQASVAEQVPTHILPAAVALNSISYNLARSFGPAIGGLIVAAAGVATAFATNALLYLPLLAALFFWRRERSHSRLPPEKMGRAMVLGVRYIVNSPPIRAVLLRTFLVGFAGSSVSALMPFIARNLIGGGAKIYGIMLGTFGIGAVLGAFQVAELRRRLTPETIARASACVMGAALIAVALSHSAIVTGAALIVAGIAWMASLTSFNITIQFAAARWVAGRSLATYQAAISGGVAIGSYAWGSVADAFGTSTAMLASGLLMTAFAYLGRWLHMPISSPSDHQAPAVLAAPDVALPLNGGSGPIVIEIEYRIDPKMAREFYNAMLALQLTRQRNGAYGWTLSRDIADPELWMERYHCPTWLDYLRQRERLTATERLVERTATDFHFGSQPFRVRRLLERPFE